MEASIDFGKDRTGRVDKFVLKTTNETVGPGSYEITKNMDRKINNPTIPREELNRSIQ